MTENRPRAFTRIYETTDHGQLALIKARLDGTAIPYYVENEFSPLAVLGGGLWLRLFVQGSRAEEARQLVHEVVGEVSP